MNDDFQIEVRLQTVGIHDVEEVNKTNVSTIIGVLIRLKVVEVVTIWVLDKPFVKI